MKKRQRILTSEKGINFQKTAGSKRVDFYINNKLIFYINDKLIVENHLSSRVHSQIPHESDKEFLKKRQEQLKPDFNGKIVLLTKPSTYAFFEKINQLGIKDTYKGVIDQFKKVKEDMARHDEFMKDDYEMDNPLEEDIF